MIEIINQPEDSNLSKKLLENLQCDEGYDEFCFVVAYVRKSGVLILKEAMMQFREKGGKIKGIIGIDQKNTSLDGIEELIEICDELHCYHNESFSKTFHPKLYYFKKEQNSAEVLIGSNNLTKGGLLLNHELSSLNKFNLTCEEDCKRFNKVESCFKSYLDDAGSCKELTEDFLKDLILNKYIFSEKRMYQEFKAKIKFAIREPRVKLFTREERAEEILEEIKDVSDSYEENKKGSLVWEKIDIPNSDAQIVSGETNVTGVLRLSQSRFKSNNQLINHKTYFISEVFNNLFWITTNRLNKQPLLVANALFQIKIGGDFIGEYDLKISHDPERISNQGNVPTTIHWGNALRKIQETNITGKSLKLFNSQDKEDNLFFIEID